jgi:hypothetical protein
MRIDKNSEEWTKIERLFLSRSSHIKLFKTDMRTSAHVDVKGTGKTLVFISTSNGAFYHYMEDHLHPDASQGDPTCVYDWQNNVSSY